MLSQGLPPPATIQEAQADRSPSCLKQANKTQACKILKDSTAESNLPDVNCLFTRALTCILSVLFALLMATCICLQYMLELSLLGFTQY